MQNPADTRFSVLDVIAQRWSPRAFADRPVATEVLGSLFEAARWAPSCFNEQPWFYVVATRDDAEAHARLAACLVDANRSWAATAPVLALSIAKLTFDRNGKTNRHAQHDVGQASMSLALQAHGMGLVTHQMAGFDADGARNTLGIPANHEPMAAFAIGYPGDLDSLPSELAERERAPRTRKALADFVLDASGTWGQPHPAVG